LAAGVDRSQRFGFVAAVGSDHRDRLHQQRRAGRPGNRHSLVEQRRRFVVLTGVYVHAGPVGVRERKNAEGARLASEPHTSGGQLVPHLVLPQVCGHATGKPEPSTLVSALAVAAAKRLERFTQYGRSRCIILGDVRRQPAEQQGRRVGGLRLGQSGARDLDHVLAVA
jgi:hypothetical protein